jgi:alkanesulfonate monooxygenase SsuD/methylene tetrahydromethanopterin reductase-like flavin-dependent oxidoreductase (luciferase family)
VVFIPTSAQLQVFNRYRERMAHHGHEVDRGKLTFGVMAYVAETDQQAEEEFMSHCMYFFESSLRTTPRYLIPPGYLTVPEFRRRISGPDVHGNANWDDLTSINRIVAGTPEKVADAIGRWAEEADVSQISLNLALGDMPHWKVVKNLTLFAEEVIPRLRSKKVTVAL